MQLPLLRCGRLAGAYIQNPMLSSRTIFNLAAHISLAAGVLTGSLSSGRAAPGSTNSTEGAFSSPAPGNQPDSSSDVHFGPPAELAPGLVRFAPAAIGPAEPDVRVMPLGRVLAGVTPLQSARMTPLPDELVQELLRQDNTLSVPGAKGRLLLGLGRTLAQPLFLNPSTAAPAKWVTAANGWQILTVEVTSSNAVGLRIHLEGLYLPPGAQVLAYSPTQSNPATPITLATLQGAHDTWTETVLGDKAVLECQVPPQEDTGKASFTIAEVSHLFLLPGIQPNTPCENDVSCYPAWLNVANGVAMIQFVENGNTYACTGCLLNTVPATYAPYFLTANHCVLNQTVASTLELWWFYQTSTCNGTPPTLAQVPHTSGGADFLATFGPNDFSFLRLHQAPPSGVQYLGWSTTAPATGAAITGIHHPGGSYKRISFGNVSGIETYFWDVRWSSGVTENGSSGSPLFNANQQVIGQLYGGTSACTNTSGIDSYGRFDLTFPYISQWLQPASSSGISLSGNLGFGSVPVGQTAAATLVINNLGNGPLTVSSIVYPTGFHGAWSGTIAANSSQSVRVFFSPTGQLPYGGSVTVNSDASSGPATAPISGTGYYPLSHPWSLWFQNADGSLAYWSMNGENATATMQVNPGTSGSGWTLAGTADFNHDGRTDLLFESAGGTLAVWFMNGVNRQSSASISPSSVDPSWQVACTGDMNRDGQKDILWQNANGSLGVWLMNGTSAAQAVSLTPGTVSPSWHLVGAADFNRDGWTDLLWQNDDGRLAVWFMNGTSQTSSVYLNPHQVNPSWHVVGITDFNGDGHPGLIWEQDTGELSYWEMSGTTKVHAGLLNPNSVAPSWRLAGPK